MLHTFLHLYLTGSSAFSVPTGDLRCRRVSLSGLMMSFIIHRSGLHRLVWHEFRLQATFQAEFFPYCAKISAKDIYLYIIYLSIYLSMYLSIYLICIHKNLIASLCTDTEIWCISAFRGSICLCVRALITMCDSLHCSCS